MTGGIFELFILFLFLGYIDSGGPGEAHYSCPKYCKAQHEHKIIKGENDGICNIMYREDIINREDNETIANSSR